MLVALRRSQVHAVQVCSPRRVGAVHGGVAVSGRAWQGRYDMPTTSEDDETFPAQVTLDARERHGLADFANALEDLEPLAKRGPG